MMVLTAEDPGSAGPYRLEYRLGSGGQGVVYAGRGPNGVLVAVKLLHQHLIADDEARVRFLREVETAKRVAPFCTAQLLDTGFAGRRPYIVSEFVDGPSLQDSVRESGPRGAAALQRLAVNTATALAAIHAAGVVHRDFKPGNVLLGPDGPVVIDFGVAKALDLSQSVVTSQPIGSPAYMAPEQIANGEVGPAADLFTWAATMYYAATGERAFPGDSVPAALHAVLSSEPDLRRLEGPFRLLLRECLAKEPALRPTAAQVVERLSALPAPAWIPAPARRPVRRRAFAAGAVALVATAGFGFYALSPSGAQQRAAGPATTASSPTPSPRPSTPKPTPTAGPGRVAQLAQSPATAPTRAPRKSATPARKTNPAPHTRVTTVYQTPRSKPTSSFPTREPTTEAPPPPSTGTATWTDANAYCHERGYTSAMGSWYDLRCNGSSTQITATTLCQWKYPKYPNAVGEQPANGFMPVANCQLS
ncbi:Serine/threonine protein kinase [Nonomuraea solani]|uniref:Serine/threonine protein kinase n=1 Tax=Nonomuraea solani TaxID=1144553 RepID=A0A1H6EL59_9ACTN|nr:serine/threonine-protein kinase [Nonomuraea solani]SEG97841.1 Serine/threonine protein kinase [Nonomuraea solani]